MLLKFQLSNRQSLTTRSPRLEVPRYAEEKAGRFQKEQLGPVHHKIHEVYAKRKW